MSHHPRATFPVKLRFGAGGTLPFACHRYVDDDETYFAIQPNHKANITSMERYA
jgi:hypothetical protein